MMCAGFLPVCRERMILLLFRPSRVLRVTLLLVSSVTKGAHEMDSIEETIKLGKITPEDAAGVRQVVGIDCEPAFLPAFFFFRWSLNRCTGLTAALHGSLC
jgi:hypothetical protein